MTPSTAKKRTQLLNFIEQELKGESAVKAVIGLGSIATGLARPDSDIDAVIFLDPLDLYIVPAEFRWRPSDRTFHSIFSKEPGLEAASIQFDFTRLDLAQWQEKTFEWAEPWRAELADGWIAFDRTGEVSDLIRERTVYRESSRIERLDEAITWLDQHLKWQDPRECWNTLGPAIAHDRLNAAYEYLSQALFAYNRRWRPWRNREMSYLVKLPWLPDNFPELALSAINAPSPEYEGYLKRMDALRDLFGALMQRLRDDGDYEQDVTTQAFIRSNNEPGRAWNMDEWNERHRSRK
jgi:predicted nucleotidyltransferase